MKQGEKEVKKNPVNKMKVDTIWMPVRYVVSVLQHYSFIYMLLSDLVE